MRLNDEILSRVKTANKRFGAFIYSITRFYVEFHRKDRVLGGFYVHDPSAVVYLIEPGVFELKEGPMRVVCEGIAIGQTIMAAYEHQFQLPAWKDQPRVRAAVAVNRERFQRTIESLLVGKER